MGVATARSQKMPRQINDRARTKKRGRRIAPIDGEGLLIGEETALVDAGSNRAGYLAEEELSEQTTADGDESTERDEHQDYGTAGFRHAEDIDLISAGLRKAGIV